jgi:hydroxyacylglutathione hydrolase
LLVCLLLALLPERYRSKNFAATRLKFLDLRDDQCRIPPVPSDQTRYATCPLMGMILKHFFEPRLAQSSYLVGCAATGQALVIDPVRRIDQYMQAADSDGLRVTDVAETHIHADFASGALALARKAGATLHVSGGGGSNWQYGFAGQPGIRTVHNGDVLHVGRVRFDVLHTPGHAPEHIAFLVTDEAVSSEPLGVFTGDFLFVGDVGRPDLLQKAVGQRDSAVTAAKELFRSVTAFALRPDRLLLWPGHGAGSACGKRLGGVPVSSLGYEKLTNWSFKTPDEDAFVRSVLADQPDPPRYFKEMKRLNRAGAPRPRTRTELRRITASDLDALVTVHAEFIDLRADATTLGYLPGSIAVPLTQQFLTQAGSVVRYGMPVYLVADDVHDALEAVDALGLIGVDDVRGWIPGFSLETYQREGGTLETLVNLDARQAVNRRENGQILLDVRSTAEWQSGHIANAMHAPLTRLLDDVRALDRDTALVVYCQAGTRSRIAATALRRVGFTYVANLVDGYAGYFSMAGAVPAIESPTSS